MCNRPVSTWGRRSETPTTQSRQILDSPIWASWGRKTARLCRQLGAGSTSPQIFKAPPHLCGPGTRMKMSNQLKIALNNVPQDCKAPGDLRTLGPCPRIQYLLIAQQQQQQHKRVREMYHPPQYAQHLSRRTGSPSAGRMDPGLNTALPRYVRTDRSAKCYDGTLQRNDRPGGAHARRRSS